ncbi:uncharacterized protein [Drosophila bipectinata]|uniref:uncharacterized protein n=1 Tax=Drosophila bipectinata TaxID=42026 RepID=UPI0007E7EE45|nr:uncharacterized protein LOC108128964 [Drosophila bipectinata]
MCLRLSFGCCGCSSPKPESKKKNSKQKPCKDTKPTKEHYYKTEIQMQEFTRSQYQLANDQMPGNNGSMASLPSMSPSLIALPHRIPTSTTLSSWACEEELCDMEEYDQRTATKWTAWWLHGATSSDQILAAANSSIFS